MFFPGFLGLGIWISIHFLPSLPGCGGPPGRFAQKDGRGLDWGNEVFFWTAFASVLVVSCARMLFLFGHSRTRHRMFPSLSRFELFCAVFLGSLCGSHGHSFQCARDAKKEDERSSQSFSAKTREESTCCRFHPFSSLRNLETMASAVSC